MRKDFDIIDKNAFFFYRCYLHDRRIHSEERIILSYLLLRVRGKKRKTERFKSSVALKYY